MRPRVIVIERPDPIVTPADIAGVADAADPAVEAMIAAVTEDIAGPDGWLGRSLGPQTLQLQAACWGDRSIRLPYGPVIDIDTVTYFDLDDVEVTVDGSMYAREGDLLWFRPGWQAPNLSSRPLPVRVTYEAGYDGGATGPVPERARQAIILAVQHLRSVGNENLFLRSVEIPDVETRQFTVSQQASELIQKTTDRLLSTLRVYTL